MHVLLSAGSNAQGQLGNASTDDSHSFQRCSFLGCGQGALPTGTSRVVSLSSGANHTVVLLEVNDASSDRPKRELWGCGSGRKGQLGPAFSDPNGSSFVFRQIILPLEQHSLAGRSYKAVCTAWEATYVVLESPGAQDVVISMGTNDFGDLGVEGKQQEKTVHVVNFDHIEVDGLSLKSNTLVVLDLSAGQHHVVVHLRAILANGSVRSFLVGWGSSRHGQLGEPPSDCKRYPVQQQFASKPRLIGTSEDVIGLSLGIQHTVLLHGSKRASGMGSNRKGQLLGLKSLSNVRCVACTWNGTYAVVDEDVGAWHVISTGSNAHGQLGRFTHSDIVSSGLNAAVEFPENINTHPLKGITCGSEHVLCLFSTEVEPGRPIAEVWGWGWNEHGNLGLGTTDDVHTPVRVLPTEWDDVLNIIDIWAGCGTSWVYAIGVPN
ncbi:hypothetical protein AX15_000642 [Amanita polypyramis BW_CC]|nr:hypothetical protein AX15_000642 [Amanita polypyramis BW_CC]